MQQDHLIRNLKWEKENSETMGEKIGMIRRGIYDLGVGMKMGNEQVVMSMLMAMISILGMGYDRYVVW